MFGRNRKPKPTVALDAKVLAQLTDEQLYLLFVPEKWNSVDKASKLALLQEIENRRAKLAGREPIRLEEGVGDEFKSPGLGGYYADHLRVIRINYRYLNGESSGHGPGSALDVVLHEGRHATQHDVMRNHPDSIPEQVYKEWKSSSACYFIPRDDMPRQQYMLVMAVYGMQPIELDARRFARMELFRIRAELKAKGLDCRDVEAAIANNLQEEARFIMLAQRLLTPALLDETERLVLAKMRERFPEIDTTNLRIFDHAREVLRAPRFNRFEDFEQLIMKLDDMEMKKLNQLKDGDVNKLKDPDINRIPNNTINRL